VFNVLDIKSSKNINDIEEGINYAEFNRNNINMFLYSTSKGFLNICDIREKATFYSGSSIKFEVGFGVKRNAFTEIINGISCAKFLYNTNNVIVTRDYLSVKLWDIRSTTNKPYLNLSVCDYLEKNLVSLYEEDSLYDKFFLDISPD
jgi:hypothetical protein